MNLSIVQNPRNIFVPCDVSHQETIKKALGFVMLEHGPIDILINNAGIVNGKSFTELTSEEIQRSFDVNILSHCWMIKVPSSACSSLIFVGGPSHHDSQWIRSYSSN